MLLRLSDQQGLTVGGRAKGQIIALKLLYHRAGEIVKYFLKVYHFFRIKDNDLNKRGRLDEAIRYYKKYGNTITSGNGYVDLLLLMSVIATGLMLVVLVGIQFMR